jgi:hypothetical protein
VVGIVLAMGWSTTAPAGARERTITQDVTVALHHDGQTRERSALRVARASASEVTAINSAHASVGCDDCRAVAIAFQVVLANRAPTGITPDNAAVAVNDACERCETVAIAYQFVVVSGDRSQLTVAGSQRLAALRVDLHRLSRSGLSAAEMGAAAEGLASEVVDILTTELRTMPTVDREVRGGS